MAAKWGWGLFLPRPAGRPCGCGGARWCWGACRGRVVVPVSNTQLSRRARWCCLCLFACCWDSLASATLCEECRPCAPLAARLCLGSGAVAAVCGSAAPFETPFPLQFHHTRTTTRRRQPLLHLSPNGSGSRRASLRLVSRQFSGSIPSVPPCNTHCITQPHLPHTHEHPVSYELFPCTCVAFSAGTRTRSGEGGDRT